MPREREVVDPYSPPPPRKDKSGRFVRYALVAAMLGAGAFGYAQLSQNADQTASLTPASSDQQIADASDVTTPEAIPQAVTPTPEATPAPAPAPAQRRTSVPAPRASTPPPVETPVTPEVAPEPVAPLSPSTTG